MQVQLMATSTASPCFRPSSTLPRLHQLQTSTLPRQEGGGVLFSEQRGLEACRALADARAASYAKDE